MSLLLGPVSFTDFELPGRIGFGGRQALAVHRLPGGGRVIDAMGRDDAPIAWSGVFSGPDAATRAATLDLLRAQGAPLPLTWDVFAYTVVISQFAAAYERSNWIPYRIVCTVLVDDTFQLPQTATPVLQTMLGDLAVAGGFGVADVSAAVAAVGVAGALVPGTAANSAAGLALGTATTTIAASLATAGTALAAATMFPAAAAAAQQCAQLAACQGFAQRAQANFAALGA